MNISDLLNPEPGFGKALLNVNVVLRMIPCTEFELSA